MIEAIKQFLTDRAKDVQLPDASMPYVDGDSGNIFFGQLPDNYMKDHDYAVLFLALQDKKKKAMRVVSRSLNAEKTAFAYTRRLYDRDVLMRCFLYSPVFDELWGGGGLMDQFDAAVAPFRYIADSGNNVVNITLSQAVRPWGMDEKQDRRMRRSHVGIVRIEFSGGIYGTNERDVIPSVDVETGIDYTVWGA